MTSIFRKLSYFTSYILNTYNPKITFFVNKIYKFALIYFNHNLKANSDLIFQVHLTVQYTLCTFKLSGVVEKFQVVQPSKWQCKRHSLQRINLNDISMIP